MKTADKEPATAEKESVTRRSRDTVSRREFLAGSAAVGATILLPGLLSAAADGKKTFTILHTNDLHSNFIGHGAGLGLHPVQAQRRHDPRRVCSSGRLDRGEKGSTPGIRVRCWYLMRVTTAWGPRSAPPSARPAANCNSCRGWVTTPPPSATTNSTSGLTAWAKSIDVAVKAGRIPAVVASNTNFAAKDATLADLQRLAKDGVIRRYVVIERGGMRFGIFGLLGKEAQFYTGGAGAVTFSDAIETGQEMVKVLRETEKVDVVIALSHGGVEKGKDGRFTDGEDVRLAKAVPGIDVVIGGHSHTALREAIIVNGRTPVVQTGKYGENLGELVITLDGDKLTGRVVQAPPDRRHHCRRPGHRRRDRQAQEDGHRGRVRVARLQHRSAAGGGAAGPAQHVHRHRRGHPPRQPLHRRLQKGHESGHRLHAPTE